MRILAITILLTILFALTGSAADTFSIGFESGRLVRQYPDRSRPVVGLALSGGGARGAAHLGVIDVLTSQGIAIDRIAGTSMGSIIGGLVAAGYDPVTLEELLETTDWSQYFSNTPPRRTIYLTEKETMQWPLFDLRFEGFKARIPSSLSAGQRISSLLTWLTAAAGYEAGGDFDYIAIPFRAVATDLTPPGNSVILDKGNLSRAIQASATVPLLFTPVSWDGMALVDGGLTNNLPIDVAREMGSDVVIGVAIDESMHPLDRLDNALNIADQATSILMRQVTNQQRPLADLLINPDMSAFSSSDFSAMDAIIDQGRRAAWEALPELRRVLADAADSCRTARITLIDVMPEQARGEVLGIMAPLISDDDDTPFGNIVAGLEQIWATGSYLSVRAVLDDDGELTVQATPLPRRMVIEFYSDGVKIADNLTVPAADVSEPVPIDRRIELMLRQFRADGHSLAHVNGMVHDRATDTLRLIVDSPVIARIDIMGREKSREALITRELQFADGDDFNLADLMNTVENLYGTNLFELVYTDIERLEDGVGIRLHVVEKNWSVVRLGMRYDETNEAEGRVTVSQENMFGIGADLSLLGQWGGRKRLLLFDVQNDRVYKSLYSYSLKTYQLSRQRTLYDDHKPLDDYQVDRYGSVFSIGQQMERLGTAMLQFKTETVWIDYPKSVGRKNEKKELRSIIAASIIDSYDQYPFPYQGYTNVLFIESANDFFGGTEQYVKLYWGGSAVVSARRKHALIGRFSLGSADRTTPLINSFTLGGNQTRLSVHDGFSGQSLFYSDFHGLNIEERYGNYLAVGSLSYRLFIPRYFYLTLTWQIGNVWDNNEAVTARSLLQAYGIEGDFATFLGPIGAGWGVTSEGDERLYLRAGWEF